MLMLILKLFLMLMLTQMLSLMLILMLMTFDDFGRLLMTLDEFGRLWTIICKSLADFGFQTEVQFKLGFQSVFGFGIGQR